MTRACGTPPRHPPTFPLRSLQSLCTPSIHSPTSADTMISKLSKAKVIARKMKQTTSSPAAKRSAPSSSRDPLPPSRGVTEVASDEEDGASDGSYIPSNHDRSDEEEDDEDRFDEVVSSDGEGVGPRKRKRRTKKALVSGEDVRSPTPSEWTQLGEDEEEEEETNIPTTEQTNMALLRMMKNQQNNWSSTVCDIAGGRIAPPPASNSNTTGRNKSGPKTTVSFDADVVAGGVMGNKQSQAVLVGAGESFEVTPNTKNFGKFHATAALAIKVEVWINVGTITVSIPLSAASRSTMIATNYSNLTGHGSGAQYTIQMEKIINLMTREVRSKLVSAFEECYSICCQPPIPPKVSKARMASLYARTLKKHLAIFPTLIAAPPGFLLTEWPFIHSFFSTVSIDPPRAPPCIRIRLHTLALV